MTDTIMLEAARKRREDIGPSGRSRKNPTTARPHGIIPRPHLPCQPNRKPNAYRRESHDRTEAR